MRAARNERAKQAIERTVVCSKRARCTLATSGRSLLYFPSMSRGSTKPPEAAAGDGLAVVVLGCRVINGAPSPLLAARLERCREVSEEISARAQLPRIIVCGGKSWEGSSEASVMKAWLVGRGVPEARIRCEESSTTTRENAHFTRLLLRFPAERSIALVTSDFHMPRAKRLFERQGFLVTPCPAPTQTTRLGRWKNLAREWGARRLEPFEENR